MPNALIFVVDDYEQNVVLLQSKLANEFYTVMTAGSVYEVLSSVKKRNPDLIILDIMMPGMDGFELCRRLKADEETAHIPVIMLTALHSASDRLRGLDVGADDFMTKPMNDIVFFARIKSLVRMKMLLDELRLRYQSATKAEGKAKNPNTFMMNVAGSRLLLIGDFAGQSAAIAKRISELYEIEIAVDYDTALEKIQTGKFDAVLLNSDTNGLEGLRLASYIKRQEHTRHIPIIIMVFEERIQTMLKALELGINDYLLLPVEHHEMMARMKTQIRRKKYQEELLDSYTQAPHRNKDGLTGLFNRSFMEIHLQNLVDQSSRFDKPLTMLVVNIDRFSYINDTYGRLIGNEMLKALSQLLLRSIRAADMAVHTNGEEFVVLLPYTDLLSASIVTDRIRKTVEATAFPINHDARVLNMTVSVGAAQLKKGENAIQFMERVDQALNDAKQNGRNQVQLAPRG